MREDAVADVDRDATPGPPRHRAGRRSGRAAAISCGRGGQDDLQRRPVVERERVVGAGLVEPQPDQFGAACPGSSAARSCSSDRSTSTWYSSQVSCSKWPQPPIAGWVVTAFQPSCQIAAGAQHRVELGLAGGRRVGGVEALAHADALDRDLGHPAHPPGCSMPRHSSTVGTRSMAWWYWWRISPRAAMPAGHETMHGSPVPPLNE